jgi:hypothetical protein
MYHVDLMILGAEKRSSQSTELGVLFALNLSTIEENIFTARKKCSEAFNQDSYFNLDWYILKNDNGGCHYVVQLSEHKK